MAVLPPDPDWYFEHVLAHAQPGEFRLVGPAGIWTRWWVERAAEVPLPAGVQGFVLAAPQVRALGVTRSKARTLVEHGDWTAAGRGLVAPLDIRESDASFASRQQVHRRRHSLHSSGAALARPRDVISGRSAAIIHGLPTMHVPATPELTVGAAAGLGRRARAHTFGAELVDGERTSWFGAPVETVARCLVSLARHGRRDAIMAADAALREGLVTRAGIDRALESARGWPWVRQARSVLALASPLAESPLESITRLALHDDGFPPPEEQYWIGDDRVDFYWPRLRYVLEADGRGKYRDDALWEEKKREATLRRRGVSVIERVLWSDIVDGWPTTRQRLWRPFVTAPHPVW